MLMSEERRCIGKLTLILLGLAGCVGQEYTLSPKNASHKPYNIKGIWYYPQAHYELVEEGMASHYGGADGCHGEPTALGEFFDMYAMTAAHRTLPLPCVIWVENLENGRCAKLYVNDRGPYAKGRILDTSVQAAKVLGFYEKGYARVRIQTLVKESEEAAKRPPGVCSGWERYVHHILHRHPPEPSPVISRPSHSSAPRAEESIDQIVRNL